MSIFSAIQRFMAITLSVGFFAHDIEFTLHIFGVTVISGIYLMALLYFHFLIYLSKTGFVKLTTAQYNKYITSMRIIIGFFAIVYCFSDASVFISTGLFSTASIRELAIDVLKLIVIIIPEIMFTIIFSFEQVMRHP